MSSSRSRRRHSRPPHQLSDEDIRALREAFEGVGRETPPQDILQHYHTSPHRRQQKHTVKNPITQTAKIQNDIKKYFQGGMTLEKLVPFPKTSFNSRDVPATEMAEEG